MNTPLVAEMPDLMLLRSTGDDVLTWWHGQLTNHVEGRQDGEHFAACLLQPTGQIEALVYCQIQGQALLMATESPEAILTRAENFVVLEDVQMEVVASGGYAVIGEQPEGQAIRQDRTDEPGWDVFNADLDPNASDEEIYDLMLRHGRPRFGVDIHERTLPPELGPRFDAEFVNHDKGCYTGQEVIERIHSRGHVNRRWVVLRLDGPTTLEAPVTADDTKIGALTQIRAIGDELLAGAYVRNEHAQPGARLVAGETSATVIRAD